MARYLGILGRSFTVPDPGDVASLSASYRAVCVNIEEAKGQLGALGSPQAWGEWTGLAADAFARSIGRLPGQLDQAGQSYNTAAWALSEYASGLGPVVAALSALAYQAEEAQGHLTAVTTAREQVIQQGQDPSTTGWDARQQDAQAAADELRSRLSSLLDEMNSLSAECVARIRQAQHEGIQNNPVSDFDRYVMPAATVAWHDADQALKVTGSVLGTLFVQPLVADVEDFRRGDWSLENIGRTLEDVATVLGIAVLVAGLFLTGVGEVATPVLLGLSIAGTAFEGAALAEHEQGASWGQFGESFVSLGLSGTSAVLSKGLDADSDLLTQAFDQGDLGQMEQLADGTDAQASADSLWNSGLQHVFSLDDAFSGVSVTNPVDALQDDLSSALNLGDDGLTHSPAAMNFQHVAFILDRGADAQNLAQDWSQVKGQDE
jgi:hypothetical protein